MMLFNTGVRVVDEVTKLRANSTATPAADVGGQCLQFNGTTDQKADFGAGSPIWKPGTAYTVSAIIRPSELTAYNTYAFWTTTQSAWWLQTVGDEVGIGFGNGQYREFNSSAANLVIGKLYHIVGSIDTTLNTVKTWVNGQSVVNTTTTQNFGTGGTSFYIGWSGFTTEFAAGNFIHLQWWNRAFSEAEVRQLYSQPYAFFVPPSIWLWRGGTSGGVSSVAGTASMDFAGTSTLKGKGKLAGTASFDFGGTSTLKGRGKVAGTADLTLDGSATGKLFGRRAGTATINLDPSATIKGKGKLSGSATVNLDGSGTLKAKGKLSGSATTDFAGTSTLKGKGKMVGSDAPFPFVLYADGTIKAKGTLSGIATINLDASGTLRAVGGGAISGTGTVNLDASGTLKGKGALSGSATVTWAESSTLRARGKLAGTGPVDLAGTGTLFADGKLIGVAGWVFDATGTLRNASAAGAISGTATIIFDARAWGLLPRHRIHRTCLL